MIFPAPVYRTQISLALHSTLKADYYTTIMAKTKTMKA